MKRSGKLIGAIIFASLAALGIAASHWPFTSATAAHHAGSAGARSASEFEPAPAWSSSAAEDIELGARVKRALLDAPRVHAQGVEVSADDAQVTLTGKVGSTEERARMAAIAQSVSGVVGVVNKLVVSSGS